MSTRVQALDVPISGPVVEIKPLSETQQLLIARAYRGDAGERILDQAWRTRGLRDLAAIPLDLTTLLSDAPGANLPTTKEEVLRLFVAEIDRNANKGEALDAVAFGFHSEILTAIAADATLADSVTVSDHRARSVISKVTGRPVSQGRIITAPQPDAIWFASQEVEKLMVAAEEDVGTGLERCLNRFSIGTRWTECGDDFGVTVSVHI